MDKFYVSRFCKILSVKGFHNAFLYISTNNSLHKISNDLAALLLDCTNNPDKIIDMPKDVIDNLQSLGAITTLNKEEDYLRRIKMDYLLEKLSNSKLILTLAPTSQCNFNCPYCFEENKPICKMSEQTISNIVKFIAKYENLKQLYLTWYGGEPLLALNIIQDILYKIRSNFPNLQIAHHFLVTNGYLINEKVIDLFRTFPLDSIQITLDGIRSRHNRLRKLKRNNSGTYDRIIRNIGIVLEALPNTNISIRVNLDKDNVNDFPTIRKKIIEKWGKHHNLFVYPGILRIEDKENRCMGCQSLLHSDIRELFYNLGDSVNFYPILQGKGCSATHLNSFLIGPRGEMYKCWNELGDESKVIGNVADNDFSNKELIRKYMLAANCFEDSLCKKCSILPICMGGCAYYRLKNLFENGNFDICSLYKDPGVLEKCISLHIESLCNSCHTGI